MNESIDYRIFRMASQAGGAVTRQALNLAGVSSSSIRRRVHKGELITPFSGVYVVPALESPDTMLHAVSLAYPSGAVCRFSAAVRLGFDVSPGPQPQFLVRKGLANNTLGLRVHETRRLPEVDVVVCKQLRTTSPSRTLCDIAWLVKPARLRHLVETQITRGHPDADDLVACVRSRRRRGVKGIKQLAEVLAFMLDDQPVGDSILEMRLFEGLAAVGLGDLVRQFRPEWYDGIRGVVDIADPVGRTIIEADGRRFRQVTQAHDNDRKRDRVAAAHGYLVLRVGYQEFVKRRAAVLAELSDVVMTRRQLAESSNILTGSAAN